MQTETTTKPRREMLAPYPFPVQYHTLPGGGQMAYIDEGQGTPILFIHGLASYLPTWETNIAYLSQYYRCIALDLPGFGRSDLGQSQGKLSDYVQSIVHLLDTLGIDQTIVMGHSMGGQTAILCGLQRPDRFFKLILVAPAGFETFSEAEQIWLRNFYSIESIAETSEAQMRRNYGYNFYRVPTDIENWLADRKRLRQSVDFEHYARAVVASMSGMLDEPVYDRLPELGVPTLVVYGEEDFLIPNRNLHPQLTTQVVATSGTDRIPGAQLSMIPEAGHFVHFEQPTAFHKVVNDFIKTPAS